MGWAIDNIFELMVFNDIQMVFNIDLNFKEIHSFKPGIYVETALNKTKPRKKIKKVN